MNASIQPKPAGHLLGTVAALTLAGVALLAFSASAARAATIAVVSCKNPTTGAAEPTEGWTPGWSGTTTSYAGDADECPQGGNLESYVGDQLGQPGSSGPIWEYQPPAGDTITGGEVSAYFDIPGGANNYTGASAISAPHLAFDDADLLGGVGDPAGGVQGSYEGAYSLTGHTGGAIFLYAFCEPPGSTCPADESSAWYWALGEIRWADIELSTHATPAATSFAGGFADPTGAVSGTQMLSFEAKDEGTTPPGVYEVRASLDGKSIYNAVPDSNGGACEVVGHRFADVYEFASAQPCKASESVSIPVDTASLQDGTHELVVSVIDAAGDESIVYDQTFTSDNAPVVQSPPTIAGTAEVGSTLTATPATFVAPEGAGALAPVSGEWVRCSDPEAMRCATIDGATASSYSPTGADVGYYLVYDSTGSDADGSTNSESAPTVAVAAAASKEASSTGGQSGDNSAGTVGGTGGGGGSGSSAGSSDLSGLTVNLSTTTTTMRGRHTPWRISLKIKPKKVRRHQKIILKGTVSTSPRPQGGKQVYLKARSVAVRWKGTHYKIVRYGKWITFDAIRTRASGAYSASHRFRLGGRHLYEFIAVAPREGGYRNKAGRSKIITVKEL